MNADSNPCSLRSLGRSPVSRSDRGSSDLRRIAELVAEHEKRFEMPGTSTLEAEVTNLSNHGFWVLLEERELFLSTPVENFPWFKGASAEAILEIERPQPQHLYWPTLDVDLSVESIEDPSLFTLVAKSSRTTNRLHADE